MGLSDYPLTEPGGVGWGELVAGARRDLAAVGCCVLPGFVRAELRETLRRECAALAPRAYHTVETVNAYNISVDTELAQDHPGRITMERGNAFVSRDCIPADSIVNQLYVDDAFQRLIAACFGLDRLFELDDPLAGLCVNVVAPGRAHPWHFDTNEFTVSMVTQSPDAGGEFEYCPNIRTATEEHFEDVRSVLAGAGAHRARRLALEPGDLQLFTGRYSLHRVRLVRGKSARHSVIFAYSERPGVIGSPSRTRQLFGRVLPEHLAAVDSSVRVRGDQLLD